MLIKFRNILAAALVFALALGSVPVLANGLNTLAPSPQNGFHFARSGTDIIITHFDGTPSSVEIPRYATGPNGGPITVIDSHAFYRHTSLQTLTFQSPSNIREIRNDAFRWTGLEELVIPTSVRNIGNGAFRDTQLRNVHFEHTDGSVITFGTNVFASPGTNFRITRPDNASNFGSSFTERVGFAATAIGETAVTTQWNLNHTTSYGGNNVMITHIPSGLQNEQRIEIPATIEGRHVRSIQGFAFDSLPNLRYVVIPESVENISSRAFNNNSQLRFAYLRHSDGSNINIAARAFEASHSSFTIRYLYGARGFSTPTWNGFSAEPTHQDDLWDFEGLAGGNEIIIRGYNGTASLVEIPRFLNNRPVRYIGNHVFRDNTHITELIIPETIVSIGANAVLNAPNLRTVRMRHSNADTIDMSGLAFSQVHRDFTIIYPANAVGFTTPYWVGFPAEPDLLGYNWEFTITANIATIVEYRGREEHVEIPEYLGGSPVRIIASDAFRNNAYIERVTIPASVNEIEAHAFFNLRNLYAAHLLHTNANQLPRFSRESFVGAALNFRLIIPNNATGFTTPHWNGYPVIPESDDQALTYGNFEYNIRRVPTPGIQGAMRDIVVITRYVGTTQDIVVPSTIEGRPVIAIDDFAFSLNTNIRRVEIPASVTDIGHSAFLGANNLEAARFMHDSAISLGSLHANTFRYTASNFSIIFTPGATGFTTPNWQGFPARSYATAAPPTTTTQPPEEDDDNDTSGQTTNNQPPADGLDPEIPGGQPQYLNPFIHTQRTLSAAMPHMTRDGEMLNPPVFRLEPFAPNPNFSTSYVMVRVIADILGLTWGFEPTTNTATFSGYNAQNQLITMELTINSNIMRVNGVSQYVRASAGVVPAISRDGRLFVPVMVFSEVYGVNIQWNPATQSVTVNP